MNAKHWSATRLSRARAADQRRALRETVGLCRTAMPIAAVGLVNLSMGITDTLMMASLDPRALASGAIIADIFSLVLQFCAGALGAVVPRIAAAHAFRDDTAVGSAIAEGVRWALVLAIAGAVLIAAAPHGLLAIGVHIPMAEVASTYALYMAATFAFMMIVALSRSVLPALGRGPVVFYIVLAVVPLNAVADAAFMYGWLGLPAMGLAGAGAASLVVAACMASAVAIYAVRTPSIRKLVIAGHLVRGGMSAGLARAGALTGANALGETGVFLSSTVLVAIVAVDAVPAHVVVFRAVAITYVLAVGFAQAVTIHAARGLAVSGPWRQRDILRAAHIGILTIGPAFFALVFVTPGLVGPFLGAKATAIAALTPWAGLAVCFLLPTVVAFGLLRAREDVLVPAIVSVVGYWGVGFTLMIALAGPGGYGALGIWMGLAAGTATTAMGSWTYLIIRGSRRTAAPVLMGTAHA